MKTLNISNLHCNESLTKKTKQVEESENVTKWTCNFSKAFLNETTQMIDEKIEAFRKANLLELLAKAMKYRSSLLEKIENVDATCNYVSDRSNSQSE